MHGASHGGHQQWSADVLMEGLAAARSSSEQPPTAAAEPRDRSSRKRSHAGGASTSSDKRHAAAPAGAGVPARAAGADDPFELNVGGRVFTTRRSTLTMEDGSMLANLFAEGSAFDEIDRDPNGRAFLDRDGDSFAVVLDYLRRSGRLAGKHSADMLSRVREDAEYFGLAGLVTAIDAHVEAVEAERVRVEEAADAKRLAETVSAEERQGAREAQLRQAKIIEYQHMLYGPLSDTPDSAAKQQETQDLLNDYARAGWRVEKMASDADGTYLDLLLSRVTSELVDG